MEYLLHYVWKHKIFPLKKLYSTDGKTIEVIDPGLHNSNAGPDFFNAKIKIDGTLWVGNVEIHDHASDWYLHGHDKDVHYNNVILHVVSKVNTEVKTASGQNLTQLELPIPNSIQEHYGELLRTDSFPRCYPIIPHLSKLMVDSWLSALGSERLEQKTDQIRSRLERCNGDWEDAYFITLARNYGFGLNGNAFEKWADFIPLHAVNKHRDDLFQIEAFFMGQAGLLNINIVPKGHQIEAIKEGYFAKLTKEYLYLSHKFSLQPMDCSLWRFMRLRPYNFPHIRLSQLANLYYQQKSGLSVLLETETLEGVRKLLQTHVTPYWETHYVFGGKSAIRVKAMTENSLNLLVINTVVPILFAYGRQHNNDNLTDRALKFLEQLKVENNYITRIWKQCGLTVNNAADGQALIQLKKEYCDKKECLRCRFGYEYLKKS